MTLPCENDATEQYVWIDLNTGLHKISPPLCEECSEDGQPPETIEVFDLTLDGQIHGCEGPFDAWDH